MRVAGWFPLTPCGLGWNLLPTWFASPDVPQALLSHVSPVCKSADPLTLIQASAQGGTGMATAPGWVDAQDGLQETGTR